MNFALQLSLLVLWSVSVASRTSTSIPSAVLGLASSAIIIGLSFVEHIKSTRPSFLLTVYLLLSIMFDATQIPTLWLTHRVVIAAVQSAVLGTKRNRAKTSYLKSTYKATCGIVDLSFVWWLNGLFLSGWRKIIGSRDLFALDPGLSSGSTGERLKQAREKNGRIFSPTLIISHADTSQVKQITCFPCLGPFSAVSGGNFSPWPFLVCV